MMDELPRSYGSQVRDREGVGGVAVVVMIKGEKENWRCGTWLA
jgi:hypothetical protein